MKLNSKIIALVMVSFLGLTACEDHGRNTTKIQYMPDMADAPTVKAQESFINPPEHSVAVNAILYPKSMEVAEQEFRSPYKASAANYQKIRAEGEALFNTHCAVCHGRGGKGDGSIKYAYPIPVPDISRAELAKRKDGFFFMKITNGGAMMPGYGYAITPQERWQIITHIRKLQGK